MAIQGFASGIVERFFIQGRLGPGVPWSGVARIATRKLDLLDYAADLAKSSGLAVDYGAVHGNDAAAALNGFVSKWGGDVLVVGSAARTGVERIVIGSVASRLVATSAVPVLVIGMLD